MTSLTMLQDRYFYCMHQIAINFYINAKYRQNGVKFIHEPDNDLPLTAATNFEIFHIFLKDLIFEYFYMETKRRRSDSVLWQKHLHLQKSQKGSDNTNNATKKFDWTAVADRLRTVNATKLPNFLIFYTVLFMFLQMFYSPKNSIGALNHWTGTRKKKNPCLCKKSVEFNH